MYVFLLSNSQTGTPASSSSLKRKNDHYLEFSGRKRWSNSSTLSTTPFTLFEPQQVPSCATLLSINSSKPFTAFVQSKISSCTTLLDEWMLDLAKLSCLNLLPGYDKHHNWIDELPGIPEGLRNQEYYVYPAILRPRNQNGAAIAGGRPSSTCPSGQSSSGTPTSRGY